MDQIRTPETEDDLLESLGRVVGALKRRRWWILLPACVLSLATLAVSRRLPNHYTSEAKILILEQQIPQSVTGAFSTTSVTDRLQIMVQEILSRSRLVAVADQFGLYPHRAEGADELIAATMRRGIDVAPADGTPGRNNFTAFTISYTADTPELAQQITNTLAYSFIESNQKTQQSQATNTAQLLGEQVTQKRRQLAGLEQRRREIEAQYLEPLPEQEEGGESGLREMRMQLQNTGSSLNRARQQRLYLESVLTSTLGGSLARLQSERTALLLRFTPQHPLVVKKDQEIARVEALLTAQKAGTPGRDDLDATSDDPTLGQLRGQLKANTQEIADLMKDEDRLKASIATEEVRVRASLAATHNRLAEAPLRREQLAAVDREFDILSQEILDLEKKQQQTGMVADMERREQGQQFRLIDPANLPVSASSPKRLKINLGGAGAGVALGLVLAFLVEIRARSFYTEKQLSQRFGVPLTMGLPVLFTPREKSRRKWGLAFEWLAGSVLMATALVGEYIAYLKG